MRNTLMGVVGLVAMTAMSGTCGGGLRATDARGVGGNDSRAGAGSDSGRTDSGIDTKSADAVPSAADAVGADAVSAADAVGEDGSQVCTWMGTELAVGQSVDTEDGCHTCTCMLGGMACKPRACSAGVDGAGPACVLPSDLSWGRVGDGSCGPYVRIDTFSVSGSGMTAFRTYNSCGIDTQTFHSCSPPPPPCGASSVVSIATLARDLDSADVKAAWAAPAQVVRYGQGIVWSISYGDGTIQVGDACWSSSCQPIPPGLQVLADDLRSLAAAMIAAPECAGL